MERSLVGFLIGLMLVGMVAFAAYRWMQGRRTVQINAWVRNFVMSRYGGIPENLHVNCTDDRRWPVIVTFDRNAAGSRHQLRFACAGVQSSFRLASETEERLPPRVRDLALAV